MPDLDRAIWDKLDPRRMSCNGDRYMVIKMDISEKTIVGGREFWLPVVDVFDERGNKKPGEDSEGKQGFFMAKIISKGNGHRLETDVTVPMFFDYDDVVLCERYTGRELRLAAGVHRIVSQVDVLCRVDDLSPPFRGRGLAPLGHPMKAHA
ncbi:MAG: hypothetical protein WCD38_11585 [Candidatus Tumulicola sp.]